MSLPVSRLVRVVLNLSPLAAQRRTFGILLIMGNSNVINVEERLRSFANITEVSDAFGTMAPEYLAAALYFSQTPKPQGLMIGRWAQAATHGYNFGGILTPTQQAIGLWDIIDDGAFRITIDGVVKTLTGLDFTSETNLNGVATIINGSLTGGTIAWDGEKFTVQSSTTGVSSIVSFGNTGTMGTDIVTMLKLTSAAGANLVSGIAAETPVAATAIVANLSPSWYGLMFASSVQPTDDQSLDVSAFIEALDLSRIYGVTIIDADVLSAVVTDDLASLQMDAGYLRSFCQYSSTEPYAIASFFGRAFSVNFSAQNSTITLMYKQEPGVAAEDLDTTQANVLQSKRCNVYVAYDNDTSIIQYGTMSGPAWFDDIHGLDWFVDAVQNACFNLNYTTPTKIPQTDAGSNQFVAEVQKVCDQAGSVTGNGLIGPGVWTSAVEFGQLKTGDFLKTGYYIYAQPIALQSQTDREARKGPPISIAAKLAGAIQEVDIIIDVNR